MPPVSCDSSFFASTSCFSNGEHWWPGRTSCSYNASVWGGSISRTSQRTSAPSTLMGVWTSALLSTTRPSRLRAGRCRQLRDRGPGRRVQSGHRRVQRGALAAGRESLTPVPPSLAHDRGKGFSTLTKRPFSPLIQDELQNHCQIPGKIQL